MTTGPWDRVERLLAIRLDNVGDVVLLGPALRALKRAMPRAEITLMASPAGTQVAPMLPWVDAVMVHRAVWQDASGSMPVDPDRERALVAEIAARNFDAAIVFTSFAQSPHAAAYACYLAGVPYRLGQSKEFGGSVLTQWVRPRPDGLHQADRNLHLITSAGIEPAGTHLELHPDDDAWAAADRVLAEVGIEPGAPFLAIAPGASCAARRYDPERFAEVALRLADASGLPGVILGSARDAETAGPAFATTRPPSVVSLAGRTTVPELTAVLARSRLVVANDSGPMHLADAFGRPMVILYSGTELEGQWQPRGAPATLLRRPTDCAPCYAFRCPYRMECLDFTPDEVVAEALDMLRRTEPAPALAPTG